MQRHALMTLRTAAVALAVTALAVAPAMAQGAAAREPLAHASFGGGAITWTPAAAHDALVLRVSGPGGMVWTEEFSAGTAPAFSLFDETGQALPDGTYTYELWAETRLDPTAQAAELATREGSAPAGHISQSGYFTVRGGAFVTPDAEEPRLPAAARAGGEAGAPGLALRDQVIIDDLIVDGSICVGFDCVNGESFGFDTLRLKENNLRIKFQDTSSSGSFPSNDWQLTANDSSNGGANRFSIDDIDNGRTPFTIEAAAPSHSLYVDDGGRVGLGTSTPVVELHVKDGDTPTLRLEQDGSSGFTPLTWDVAGNETNFFIRDVTNGSDLPFRILDNPGSDAIVIDTGGEVGIGTASPSSALHVRRANGTAQILVQEASGTSGARSLLDLRNNGQVNFTVSPDNGTTEWQWQTAVNSFTFTQLGSGGAELTLDNDGDMLLRGALTVCGGPSPTCSPTTSLPDYVFEPDYPLMPLDELGAFIEQEKHLPNVMSVADVGGGINMTQLQLQVLEKVEELTLYTLQQQGTIEDLRRKNSDLSARLQALEAALTAAGGVQ